MLKKFLVFMSFFYCLDAVLHDAEGESNSKFIIHTKTLTFHNLSNNSSATSNPALEVKLDQKTEQKNDQKNEQVITTLNEIRSEIKDLQKQLIEQSADVKSEQASLQEMSNTLANKLDSVHSQLQSQLTKTDLENALVVKNIPVPVGKNISTQATDILAFVWNWIDHNKIVVGCVGVATIYSYIFYEIYHRNRILNDPLAWSNWYDNKKLEDLFAVPVAQLQTDLLYAFQHRYIDEADPMNFAYSLQKSSYALDQEIACVKKQIQWYQWIIYCKCSPIFFINLSSLDELEDKRRKLAFMKHIFSSWCAQSKIDKNN